MTAILQTVPLPPSSVAASTMYMPLATRLPLRSHPFQRYEPPVLLPWFTRVPFEVTIFTSAL